MPAPHAVDLPVATVIPEALVTSAKSFAAIPEQRERIADRPHDKDVRTPVVVYIAKIRSHAGDGSAVFVVCHAAFDPGFS